MKQDNPEAADFRVTPVRPIDELRREALAAEPPSVGSGPSDLVDLAARIPALRLDVRYATADNFLGAVLYEASRAFLQRPAAEALARVQADLEAQGLELLVYDGYRPWYVTKLLWEATPPAFRRYVANPAEGSRHNRGCAVDCTLWDRETGRPLPMPSGFDEFTPRAHSDYDDGPAERRRNRARLRTAMERHGFTVNPIEWWHFDHEAWPTYPLLNVPFSELDSPLNRTG